MATIDVSVSTGVDDGGWDAGGATTVFTSSPVSFQSTTVNCYFARFTGISIPAGATIDNAYLEVWNRDTEATVSFNVYAVDEQDPATITSVADGDGRARTTATLLYTTALSAGGYFSTGTDSINSIIEELLASYDYSSARAMLFIFQSNSALTMRWDCIETAGHPPKLHIEYTEAAAGDAPVARTIEIGGHFGTMAQPIGGAGLILLN